MEISLVPHCPICETKIPYRIAPHNADCIYAKGFIENPNDEVETTVFRAYAKYPELFGRTAWARWYIFNQLFCVLGSGHVWRDGKIVDLFESDIPLKSIKIKEREPRMSLSPESTILMQRHMSELFADMTAPPEEDFAPTCFYPIYEETNLATVPDDVHPDWLEAAFDAVDMLAIVSRDAHNKEWARMIVFDFRQRFGDAWIRHRKPA